MNLGILTPPRDSRNCSSQTPKIRSDLRPKRKRIEKLAQENLYRLSEGMENAPPLKQQRTTKGKVIRGRRLLFKGVPEESQIPIDQRVNSTHPDFKKLKSLMISMEAMSLRADAPSHIEKVVRYLKSICDSDRSLEEKKIQIGLFRYYYCNRGLVDFEFNNNWLSKRADELCHDLDDFEVEMRESPSKLVASCKIPRLLKGLARMIIDSSTAQFNEGGVLAILALIDEPRYGLVSHLDPSHRDHIRFVIKNLLTCQRCQLFFEGDIRACDKIDHLIRLTLKYHTNYRIKKSDIFQAIIVAILSDLRQQDRGNCYAIAPILTLLQTNTYVILTRLKALIETGSLIGSQIQNQNLALSLILNRFKTPDFLFDVKYSTLQVQTSSAIGYAAEIQSINLETLTPDQFRTLKQHIKKASHNSSNHLKIDETLKEMSCFFDAFGKDPLVELLIVAHEFRENYYLDSIRNKFFHSLLEKFPQMDVKFKELLMDKIQDSVWVEEILPTLNDRYFEWDGFLYPYNGCIARFFTFHDNSYCAIGSLSQLQEFIVKLAKELSPKSDLLIEKLSSKNFKLILAQVCCDYLGDNPPPKRYLLQSDVFMIQYTGGRIRYKQANGELELSNRMVKVENGLANPKEFLLHLSSIVLELNLYQDDSYKPCLFLGDSHVSIFYPHRVAPFIELTQEKQKKTLENLERRFERFFDQSIPPDILSDLGKDILNLQVHPNEEMTFGEMRSRILDLRHTNSHTLSVIRNAFNHACSRVALSADLIASILNRLRINRPIVGELLESLQKGGCKTSSMPLYLLAESLSYLLAKMKIYAIDPFKLERLIADHLQRPYSFVIGDLNWCLSNSIRGEPTSHIYFEVAYDFLNLNLMFGTRSSNFRKPYKSIEKQPDKDFYFTTFFENISSH